jgi:proton-coupled amino acid transporter
MNTKEATKVIQATQAVTKNKREENATSSLDAFVTVIKGNIGIGILALPLAFNKAGYLVAAVLLILMGIITTHCMWLLVTSAQTLSKRLGVEALEYGQVSELAFLSLHCEQINLGLCHISTTSLGKLCKLVVNFFLMLTQFGLSIVYFAFIAGSLQFVVSNTPYIKYDISVRIWIVIILVPFVLITYIRDLRTLSPFVAVANGCLFFVLSVIIVDAVYRFTTKQAAVNCEQQNFNITVDPSLAMICGVNPWPLSLNDLFVFFGMAVFTFEGIGFILPVENKMAKPQHFKPVLIVGMSVITVTYFSVGLLGYLSYGVCASANLTFDLRSNNVWLKS